MNTAPVVIGGLGGSGTRVVADILISLGWYFGNDLNSAHDNQLFTLLFKRPEWFLQADLQQEDISDELLLFENLMAGVYPGMKQWQIIVKAVGDSMRHGHDYIGSKRGGFLYRALSHYIWPLIRVGKILHPGFSRKQLPARWGWKEPNSHIYLQHLVRYYPEMKYIHVIRHGLDMAFSSNQAQLYNWGYLFGIEPPPHASGQIMVRRALDFWIAANDRAIHLGQKLLGKRFLVVNYDDLCAHPMKVVQNICTFLGNGSDQRIVDDLARIPRKLKTLGRYRLNDLTAFDEKQVDAVRRLGFHV